MKKLLIQLGLILVLLIGNFGFSTVMAEGATPTEPLRESDDTTQDDFTREAPPASTTTTTGGTQETKCDERAKLINGVCTHTFPITNLQVNEQKTRASKVIAAGNPVGALIVTVINTIAYVIGSVAFLGVVVGGFLMITSAGNSGLLTKGKMFITYSLIGLVIVFTAFFIVAFVQGILFESTS